ncbi:hypothetical protein [Clostridium brassicae]|uniref:Uncharacterized protein n=1 Tax=Clostridium brassicae TaxID=2999072 RepID=A0ABT4D6H0_9CLOT|nr:hypothetical protein [Clostridium brassicae]MCY6957895.1 hypothetical protein [Clostridium brassicae]
MNELEILFNYMIDYLKGGWTFEDMKQIIKDYYCDPYLDLKCIELRDCMEALETEIIK